MPLHKRSSTRHKNNDNQMDTSEPKPIEQSSTLGNKHKRIIYDPNPTSSIGSSGNSKSMDFVTNGCKRIKIGSLTDNMSDNKRDPPDLKLDSCFSQKTKRQKITWP